MDAIARTRIGRVKLKAGGEVRLLRQEADPARAKVERDIRDTLDAQGEIAGFGLVVWGSDGGSSCAQWCGPGSKIPTPLIPDFVRNRLLLGTGVRWTLDDVNDAWGHPPGDAS